VPAPKGRVYVVKRNGIFPAGTVFRARSGSTSGYNEYQNARAHRLGYTSYTEEKSAKATPEYKLYQERYRESLADGGRRYGLNEQREFNRLFARDYQGQKAGLLGDQCPGSGQRASKPVCPFCERTFATLRRNRDGSYTIPKHKPLLRIPMSPEIERLTKKYPKLRRIEDVTVDEFSESDAAMDYPNPYEIEF